MHYPYYINTPRHNIRTFLVYKDVKLEIFWRMVLRFITLLVLGNYAMRNIFI